MDAQAGDSPRGDDGGAAHPGWVLATSMLASSLSFVDGSVVNVSLPFIGQALGSSPAALQWVVDAYLLPLSALILLGGAAGDRFGRGRLLVLGVALFGAASLVCALAPGYPVLLAARAAQGVGAAILLPNSLASLAATFQGEARGKAVGAWSATGAAAAAVGPPLGGWLADSFGWRAIFFINIPVALAAMATAWLFVRDRGGGERQGRFDLPGGALATVGLGLLAWGLTLGSEPGGDHGRAWALGATGLLALALFAWVERRRGDAAMTPLELFASKPFVGLSLLTFLVYGALGGLLVVLPLVLVRQFGFHGIAAGSSLLPIAVVLMCLSPVAGAVAGRIGSKPLLTTGPVLLAGGLFLLLRVGEPGRYFTTVLPAVVTIALGMACIAAPLTTAVLGSVDGRHSGTASGFNSAVSRAGGLIATALLGGVLAAQKGPALLTAFHLAATVGAVACLLGAVCAALLLQSRREEKTGR